MLFQNMTSSPNNQSGVLTVIRTIKLWMTIIFVAFFVSGCGGGKGDGFIGKWVGKNDEAMFKPSYVMIITKDGDNFHVDIDETMDTLGYGNLETTKQKFEAKAESDTVLSLFGGLATMRLEKGVISFDGTSFTKSS